MEKSDAKNRMIGDNEGLGSGAIPMPRDFTGGSDDFFVQFTNSTDGSYEYELECGPMSGLHYMEDDD